MKKIFRIISKNLFILLLFTVSTVNAGRDGVAFGGSFLGGMMGTTLGSAINRHHTRTVVVNQSGTVSRSELIQLENVVRDDFNRLYEMFREQAKRQSDRIRDLEDQIASLRVKMNSK